MILIRISSHVLQGRESGTQPTPASQMAMGRDQATWPSPSGFYSADLSSLIGSPSSFNLSYLVDTGSQQSTQLNTSRNQPTASAAAGSAAQLQAQMQHQTEMDSARDEVTEADPGDELWKYSFAILFENIRLLFCLKVFVCYFVWKYSFAILFESIRLPFCLKVFVCYFVWKHSFDLLFLQW